MKSEILKAPSRELLLFCARDNSGHNLQLMATHFPQPFVELIANHSRVFPEGFNGLRVRALNEILNGQTFGIQEIDWGSEASHVKTTSTGIR